MTLLKVHNPQSPQSYGLIDFDKLAQRLNRVSIWILEELLPQGIQSGNEWKALNPQRDDKHVGSFSVNVTNGAWSDFAIGVGGGDLISLTAYLKGMSQAEAAVWLCRECGEDVDDYQL